MCTFSKEFLSKGREGLPWAKKIYMLAGCRSRGSAIGKGFQVCDGVGQLVSISPGACSSRRHGAALQVEMEVKILWTIFEDATKQIEKEIHFSEDWVLIMPAGSRCSGGCTRDPGQGGLVS